MLSKKQRKFAKAVGLLICFAYQEGYELTFGDAYRDPRVFGKEGEKKGYSAANSIHKLRLAVDLNLWINDEWIESSEHPAWKELHYFFELQGGAPMIKNDANHFSFLHYGRR